MAATSQWRHNEHDGFSNHRHLDCLLNCLFRLRSKKTSTWSKLCVTDLSEGNSPVTDEFPSQRASNMENVSIWWHQHDFVLASVYNITKADWTKQCFCWSIFHMTEAGVWTYYQVCTHTVVLDKAVICGKYFSHNWIQYIQGLKYPYDQWSGSSKTACLASGFRQISLNPIICIEKCKILEVRQIKLFYMLSKYIYAVFHKSKFFR